MIDAVAAPLYAQSCFLHGYIHGYEEGFHNGDIDLQFAHGFRDVNTLGDYKKVKGYQHSFGQKDDFEQGFRQGFRVGYIDAVSGRSFRAVQLLRSAADGLQLSQWPSGEKGAFESGVLDGYTAGKKEGLHDGRTATAFRPGAPGCTPLDRGYSATDPAYCQGFQRAFLIGYSDGYTNQQDNTRIAVK